MNLRTDNTLKKLILGLAGLCAIGIPFSIWLVAGAFTDFKPELIRIQIISTCVFLLCSGLFFLGIRLSRGLTVSQEPPFVDPPTFIEILIMQTVTYLLFELTLDTGLLVTAARYSYLGYLAGVAIIFVRRQTALLPSDIYYLKFAWIPILIICIPVYFHIWRAKGLIP